MSVRPVEFAARDGFKLGGTLYRPAQPNGRAVLVNAAVGVRQQYYSAFAAFLEERGFTVLTYDYRGIAASRHGHVRDLPARLRDWAQLDAAAALEELARAAPGAPLLAVCHSFGGNGLGLVPGNERFAGALFVGVQSGYWRHWSGLGRVGMWFLTHALLPVMSARAWLRAGRAVRPGRRPARGRGERMGGLVPPPRAMPPGALGEQEAYVSISRRRSAAYWIADDGYAPRAATEAILAEYPRPPARSWPSDPAAPRGRQPIGHFGFFRERFRDTLWREAADWLDAVAG